MVMLKVEPAVVPLGALPANRVAAAGETAIAPQVPLIEPLTVSVAVIVRLPAVLSVKLNVPARRRRQCW